jgi:hypothetical protein
LRRAPRRASLDGFEHRGTPNSRQKRSGEFSTGTFGEISTGIDITGANGEAVVTLPDYFEALNRDFRYLLTVIGQFAQAIVESEIADSRFTIKTDQPKVKVSWQ